MLELAASLCFLWRAGAGIWQKEQKLVTDVSEKTHGFVDVTNRFVKDGYLEL